MWTRTLFDELLSDPRNLLEDQNGQTMAEYALILTLILIVSAAVIALRGGQISSIFVSVTGQL